MTTIKRWKVLFQGSCKTKRGDNVEQLLRAEPIARAVGDLLIRHDFELILGGTRGIEDAETARIQSGVETGQAAWRLIRRHAWSFNRMG